MRILLTGVTGLLGRAVARQLIAAGHGVTGTAAYPHANLHPDVHFVCTSLADPVLLRLADAADVVLHLAPVEPDVPGTAGIDGLVRVAYAAARAGARLILPSVAAGAPALYDQAETLVADGWAPSLIVRTAPPVGRQLDWMICRTIGSLTYARAPTDSIRVVHFDDLLRFLVLAVATNRTGVVDLANPDAIDVATARSLLRVSRPRPRMARLPSWHNLTPSFDIETLQEAWQFEFAWCTSDAIFDTRRGLDGRKFGFRGAVDLRGRCPLPTEVSLPVEPLDGHPLQPAPLDEQGGEFDDRVDPRFPVFSAVPLARTLPGPLTPMTLDVQIAGLRAAARMVGSVLACGDVFAAEWASRAVTVFGHRPYVGVSASAIGAEQLPGWDVDETVRASLDTSTVDALFPLGRPSQAGPMSSAAMKAVVVTRALTLLRHLKTDTQAYREAAQTECLGGTQVMSLSDAQLQARVRLLRDRIHQGWALTGLWLVDTGVTAATVERRGVCLAVTGLGALLDSDAVAAESSKLAGSIRNDRQLCALATDGDLEGILAQSPAVGAQFDGALERLGHRGPGEVELANLMIGDDPAILLAAAGRDATEMPRRMPSDAAAPKLAERMAANARASREMAYDTTIRFTHQLRMTLRELGSRFVDAELIDVDGEIFYLTCDEVVTLPSDARLRVKRRRAERERFQGLRLPDVILVS